ncbi:hypothetical protein [Phosphitispora fastidiosa]|uniref:hypothetical protein n=1 Tax=Phosphitispora fastidiosa TaxID=2837202 RepID=UPI001E44395D|nr:hypothetical protein [Phosphitispora fastidiosa]MBU7005892.1 hypothetical protein [Phosphitispora fastidiosa]
MKQPDLSIGAILENALQNQSTSVPFESVWNKRLKKGKKPLGLKRSVAIALISLFTLFSAGFVSFTVFRNVDKTDYPFVSDVRLIGKWETVDYIDEVETFNPEKKQVKGDLFLGSLVFIKEGKMLFSTENGPLTYTAFTWTKDMILDKQEQTASKCELKEINGTTYMFFEWKAGEYIFFHIKPSYYVLKKVDSDDYSNYIIARNEDKTDYPFINDTNMLGQWKSVDFVEAVGDFKPGTKSWLPDLFLNELVFEENGELTVTTTSEKYSNPSVSWTKGLIINKTEETASKCEIKEIDGTTYMFFEWKNRDYIFGGKKPYYYVLKKVE